MTTHLDDLQLSAILASAELDRRTRDHIDSCIVCRRRLESFRVTVDGYRHDLGESAPDFEMQRRAILERLRDAPTAAPRRRRERWIRPLLAAAATALLVTGAGLLQHSTRQTAIPTPRPDLPIEDILAETDALLADTTIPGFDILDRFSEADLESVLDGQSPEQ